MACVLQTAKQAHYSPKRCPIDHREQARLGMLNLLDMLRLKAQETRARTDVDAAARHALQAIPSSLAVLGLTLRRPFIHLLSDELGQWRD